MMKISACMSLKSNRTTYTSLFAKTLNEQIITNIPMAIYLYRLHAARFCCSFLRLLPVEAKLEPRLLKWPSHNA